VVAAPRDLKDGRALSPVRRAHHHLVQAASAAAVPGGPGALAAHAQLLPSLQVERHLAGQPGDPRTQVPVRGLLALRVQPGQLVPEAGQRPRGEAVGRQPAAVGEAPGAVGVLPAPHSGHAIGQLNRQPHPHRATGVVSDAPTVVTLSPPPGHRRAYAVDAVVAVEPAGLEHLPLVPYRGPADPLGAAPREVRGRTCRPGEVQAHPRARIIAVHPQVPPLIGFHDPYRHGAHHGGRWLITRGPGLPGEEVVTADQAHLVAVEHFVRGVAGHRQHKHVAGGVRPVGHEEIAFPPVPGDPGGRRCARNPVTKAFACGFEVSRYGIAQTSLLSCSRHEAGGAADQARLTWIACEAARFAMAAKTSSPRGVLSTSTHPIMAMMRPPNA
jgi:hypothetical protein